MSERPLHILLLCNFEPGTAGTILEHIHAFPRWSRHRYSVLSMMGALPDWIDLGRFDGVIVHYSLIASHDAYLAPEARRRIREFNGFKAAFVQDDYRWINRTVEAMAYLRIHALFGLAGPDIIDAVYSPDKLPGVRRETVLTGYAPEPLTRLPVPPLAERPIDVGYRARKLPAWIGSHTLQKWQIADRFAADAPRYGLTVDLSHREEDRIYGDRWIQFVSNCKAVLGTESGASVCDFTGEIQTNVEAHVARDPGASFETLRDLYFKGEDGRIMMNVISPRCFEAAALRTLMILYEGHYSGVLVPWRHYVPLRMDHSNMDEVVAVLRDLPGAQAIVDTAFREVAQNPAYTFAALVAQVDRVIDETAIATGTRHGYAAEEFAWRLRGSARDMTKYARVSSPVATATGAGFDRVLSPLPDRQSVVSAAGQPLPHALDFAFDLPLRVTGIHLVWDHPTAAAVAGVAELHSADGSVARVEWSAPSLQYTCITAPGPFPRLVRVRLLFNGYHDGDTLRLHDVRFEVASLPMLERIRQTRAKLAYWLPRLLSEYWMQIPEPVRRALRKPVRKTYDTIFGRR